MAATPIINTQSIFFGGGSDLIVTEHSDIHTHAITSYIFTHSYTFIHLHSIPDMYNSIV